MSLIIITQGWGVGRLRFPSYFWREGLWTMEIMAGGSFGPAGVAKERAEHYRGKVTVYVIIACSVAAVGGSIFGYDIGISGTFNFLDQNFWQIRCCFRFFDDYYGGGAYTKDCHAKELFLVSQYWIKGGVKSSVFLPFFFFLGEKFSCHVTFIWVACAIMESDSKAI